MLTSSIVLFCDLFVDIDGLCFAPALDVTIGGFATQPAVNEKNMRLEMGEMPEFVVDIIQQFNHQHNKITRPAIQNLKKQTDHSPGVVQLRSYPTKKNKSIIPKSLTLLENCAEAHEYLHDFV